MQITKYAHACLLIEEGDTRILIDPGNWNPTPDAEELDVLLITHEHQDHLDIEQVKAIQERNPGIVIITHAAAGKLLEEAGIAFTPIEPGSEMNIKGVSIESFGTEHALLYTGMPVCRNTGFLIAEKLFVPGDALHDVPSKPVEVLALPTGGPWMRLSEAIDYAKKVAPAVIFPIHDAMHTEDYSRGFVTGIVGGRLAEAGIAFRDMAAGAVEEF